MLYNLLILLSWNVLKFYDIIYHPTTDAIRVLPGHVAVHCYDPHLYALFYHSIYDHLVI